MFCSKDESKEITKMKKLIAGIMYVLISSLLWGTGTFASDRISKIRGEPAEVSLPSKGTDQVMPGSGPTGFGPSPSGGYGLGDLGKPPNYDQTIKRFREIIPGFDMYGDMALPGSWTGQYTTAKDQGSCGSCWAFAAAGAMESKILIAGGPTYDLSEQEQISCNSCQYGCCGGWSTALMQWYRQGPMQESCTGYADYTFLCPAEPPYFGVSCSSMNSCNRLSYYTTGYYTVDMSYPNEIKTSLYNDGPTYFRFDVYDDFSKPGSSNDWWETAGPGDVYTNSSGSTYKGGHAVLIVGWSDTKSAWLCKNSWGVTGGPEGNGTFWIAYSGHSHDLNFGMANVQVTRTIQSWAQPNDFSGYGVASDYFTDYSNGAYSADDFTITRPWSINVIVTEGSIGDGTTYTLNDATNLNWYIYPDSSGVPAGYPGDGSGTEVWSHSCLPSASEVTIGGIYGGDATLDVVTAKGSPINLEPGTYWLCFYPSLNYASYGQWYWFRSCTQNPQPAHLIDPGDLYGDGYTTWTSWQTVTGDTDDYDAAFHFEGSSTTELINDGSFENGPPAASAWTEWKDPAGSSRILDVSPFFYCSGTSVYSYDGTYSWWGGGYTGAQNDIPVSNYVEQEVTIPNDATQLSFYTLFYRPDDDDSVPEDVFIVTVSGEPVFTKNMVQANDSCPDWVEQVVDISGYAGQTVTLRFYAESGNSDNTGNVAVDYITICKGGVPEPEMDVLGNGSSINDGDSSPSVIDDTEFGSVHTTFLLSRTSAPQI
jgi:hypothetical protein